MYEGDSYLNKLSINKIIEVGSSDGALLDEPLSHKDHDIWQMVLDAFLVYIQPQVMEWINQMSTNMIACLRLLL